MEFTFAQFFLILLMCFWRLKIRIRFQVMDLKINQALAIEFFFHTNINSQLKAWWRLRPQVSVLHFILLKVFCFRIRFYRSLIWIGLVIYMWSCGWWQVENRKKRSKSHFTKLLSGIHMCVTGFICCLRVSNGCGVLSCKLSFYGAKFVN